ncbi:DUF72 domain-containing protein [Nemorincola caseinilytica]|uniref:DUF72 domain-containing protein n=1 Tax=Nemorincola caseinilytica TaxID=2054315 RepID=A0ABP8N7I3_9BACT
MPVAGKAQFPIAYRSKSRLHYYATLFNSVEINSTFYKIPMPKTVARWSDDVPEHFRFTFKLWRGMTHVRELVCEPADVGRYMEAINMVGTKKGCLLVQFPASIKASYMRHVQRLLQDILQSGKADGWALAVEFRDRSWYRDEVYEMLEQYRATIVIHDMPRSATPEIDMQTDTVYLRFHGERGDYKGDYENDILRGYADKVKDHIAEGKNVYAYFNNTLGAAVHNAMMLQALGSATIK